MATANIARELLARQRIPERSNADRAPRAVFRRGLPLSAVTGDLLAAVTPLQHDAIPARGAAACRVCAVRLRGFALVGGLARRPGLPLGCSADIRTAGNPPGTLDERSTNGRGTGPTSREEPGSRTVANRRRNQPSN